MSFQKRTPHCLLCNKKDHFFKACPSINPKDTMRVHLRLQMQINDLMEKIKKKGANMAVIPVTKLHSLALIQPTVKNPLILLRIFGRAMQEHQALLPRPH
jgi:hypothetical protein